jgi:hypothetical protein
MKNAPANKKMKRHFTVKKGGLANFYQHVLNQCPQNLKTAHQKVGVNWR